MWLQGTAKVAELRAEAEKQLTAKSVGKALECYEQAIKVASDAAERSELQLKAAGLYVQERRCVAWAQHAGRYRQPLACSAIGSGRMVYMPQGVHGSGGGLISHRLKSGLILATPLAQFACSSV